MTNGSKSLEDARFGAYVRGFIAERLAIPRDSIETFRFVATPGCDWSEYTIEDFDCLIDVMLVGGEKRNLFLNATETCDFLNGWALA